jgi:hypothetical protein
METNYTIAYKLLYQIDLNVYKKHGDDYETSRVISGKFNVCRRDGQNM